MCDYVRTVTNYKKLPRCSNQNNDVEEIHQKKNQDYINSYDKYVVAALMLVDYKMKFEPMSQRETILDHYGEVSHDMGSACNFTYYSLKKEWLLWYKSPNKIYSLLGPNSIQWEQTRFSFSLISTGWCAVRNFKWIIIYF